MKKKTLAFKTMAASLAAVAAMSCTSLTAFADKIKTIDGVSYRYSDSGEKIGKFSGWAKTSKGRRYYKNGVMYKNKWIKTKSGKYYYAGADGYMRTGWAKVTRGKATSVISTKTASGTEKPIIGDISPRTFTLSSLTMISSPAMSITMQ